MLIQWALILGVPVIGITAGIVIERRHLKSLASREEETRDFVVTDLKSPPQGEDWQRSLLVTGACVVASDYFKVLASSLRGIFGGQIKSLQRMQDRARREAILRMLADARAQGATAVHNVRVETSTINGKNPKNVAGVEVLAYGTALIPAR